VCSPHNVCSEDGLFPRDDLSPDDHVRTKNDVRTENPLCEAAHQILSRDDKRTQDDLCAEGSHPDPQIPSDDDLRARYHLSSRGSPEGCHSEVNLVTTRAQG
jgi:hypothetical protein